MISSKQFAHFFLLLFVLAFCAQALAVLPQESLKIFAVTEDGKGMIADITLETSPGKGRVLFFVSDSLIGTDTQETGVIALNVAKKLSPGIDTTKYDYTFDIQANASEVDGPSAGAAMALLFYSSLNEKPLQKNIGLTGSILSDGSVGVVGGVLAKAKAASEGGIELFMIPKGEAQQLSVDEGKTVNLLTYGPEKLNMKIVEVATIQDAIKFSYSDIDSIQVDSNDTASVCIPLGLKIRSSLLPMKIFSQRYIDRAKASTKDAIEKLKTTTLDESIRPSLYPEIGRANWNIDRAEMSFDQNYLYSSANYAFNAKILSTAIAEVSENPSLLARGSTILDSKIDSLRHDIVEAKKKFDFIPIDKIEWMIGSQQRIAYAENALNNIEQSAISEDDVPEKDIASFLFDKVYNYASAKSWLEASNDFFEEAKSSTQKKIPNYSPEFIAKVDSRINFIEKILSDGNVQLSVESMTEAKKRLAAAKISKSSGFYFAALYDTYFSEAFALGEKEREIIDNNKLFSEIEELTISNTDSFSSVWANLFFDHSKFFFENSKCDLGIGRVNESIADLKTSFDLIFLSKKIELSKDEVISYLRETDFEAFVGTNYDSGNGNTGDVSVQVEYTRVENPLTSVIVVVGLLVLLVLLIAVYFGLRSNSFHERGSINARITRVQNLIRKIEEDLANKKISDAEYFYARKKLDVELEQLLDKRAERSKLMLGLDESRAKIFALEKSLSDLNKHYRSGIIVKTDYISRGKDITKQLDLLKTRMGSLKEKLSTLGPGSLNVSGIDNEDLIKINKSFAKPKRFSEIKKGEKIKGTVELAKDEFVAEKKEQAKNKIILKKYERKSSYKVTKKKKK